MHGRAAVLGLGWMLLACGPGGETGTLPNNGHHNQVTFRSAGLPAEGADMVVHVSVLARCAGDDCAVPLELMAVDADCNDPVVCKVEGVEVVPGEREARVRVRAGRRGVALLNVRATLLDGTVREDQWCITVARVTEVRVDCPGCASGIPVGQRGDARCTLWNPSVSKEPLVGACEAWAATADVAVEAVVAGGGGGAGAAGEMSAVPNDATSRFEVLRREPPAADVVFQHRGLAVRVRVR